MSANVDLNVRPDPDKELVDIADYVTGFKISSAEAYDTARNCLIDTLGCGFLAQRFPECSNILDRSSQALRFATEQGCPVRSSNSIR